MLSFTYFIDLFVYLAAFLFNGIQYRCYNGPRSWHLDLRPLRSDKSSLDLWMAHASMSSKLAMVAP